jgi:pre-mRNA-splicing helicase BRR2
MMEQAEARVAKYSANTYETKAELKEHTFKEEDNFDWKFVQIIPPPKKEMPQGDRVQIDSLPKYARAAFGYTKALNQIQSIVYPVAFKQSRSMIVAAPTGAGKTNVALLTILR